MKVPKRTYDLLSNPNATLAQLNPAYDRLVKLAIEQGRDPDKNGFVQRFAARILELMQDEQKPEEILAALDVRRAKARGKKGPEELAHINRTATDFVQKHPHEETPDFGIPVAIDRGLVLTSQEAGTRRL